MPEDILARAHAALVAESKAFSRTRYSSGSGNNSSNGRGGSGGDPWDFYSSLEDASEHESLEAVEHWNGGGGGGAGANHRRLSSEFISVAYRYTNLAWRGGSAAAAA